MITKGYGLSIEDIDYSSPADMEAYAKAYQLEEKHKDELVYAWCGNYMISALTVAIDHCFSKKAKSKYMKEPITARLFENDGLTEEEIYERELQKALFAEEQWIRNDKKRGLPETVI